MFGSNNSTGTWTDLSIGLLTTEAHIRIANDCGTHDVVISTDGDMLVYKTVSRIWRPISKRRFLQYKVSEVLDSLQITRTRLTALGIVSRSDYNRNVAMAVGLGQFSSSSRLSLLHETFMAFFVQKVSIFCQSYVSLPAV